MFQYILVMIKSCFAGPQLSHFFLSFMSSLPVSPVTSTSEVKMGAPVAQLLTLTEIWPFPPQLTWVAIKTKWKTCTLWVWYTRGKMHSNGLLTNGGKSNVSLNIRLDEQPAKSHIRSSPGDLTQISQVNLSTGILELSRVIFFPTFPSLKPNDTKSRKPQ